MNDESSRREPPRSEEGAKWVSVGFSWNSLRPALLESIEGLIVDMGARTARERIVGESKALLQQGVAAVKERLRREGLKNEQIEAAVLKSHAESAREHAAERKTQAEAEGIELKNSINRLRLVIGVALAVIAVEPGEDGSAALQELERLASTLDAIGATII